MSTSTFSPATNAATRSAPATRPTSASSATPRPPRVAPGPFAKILAAALARTPERAPLHRGSSGPAVTRSPRPPEPASPATTNSLSRKEGRAEVSDDAAERDGLDPLDPATRYAAQLGAPHHAQLAAPAPPLEASAAPVHAQTAARAPLSMEELLPQLVRRIAWAGDRRRGTVHMELGAGRHAGSTITVHADAGRVRVEVQGADAEELRERIQARLERQGIDVESVT